MLLLRRLGLFAGILSLFVMPQSVSAEGDNLVSNPSMEVAAGALPQNWLQGNWGTNTAAFSYPTGDAHSGERFVRVTMQSYSSGDAKWYFTPAAVTPGAYVYRDYYRSNVQTTLVAQLETANGFQYQHMGTLPAASSWTKSELTLQVSSGITKATVFHLIDRVGVLDLDTVTFASNETTPPPPPPAGGNILNPSVEVKDPVANKPQSWEQSFWGNLRPTFAYLSTGHSGSRSVRVIVKGYKSGDAKWTHAPVTVTAGKEYQFSDWYMSTVDSFVVAEVSLTNGEKRYLELGRAAKSSVWKQYSAVFTAPTGAATVTVMHLLRSNGSLVTDDYALAEYTPPPGFEQGIVSLTFDDGWASFSTAAMPILAAAQFPATAYLISGALSDWGYLTPDQVWGLRAAGHEIAAHTVTHPHLPTLTTAQISAELLDSKAALQQYNVPVRNFASPYGEVDDRVMTIVRQAYRSHRGIEMGFNRLGLTDPYNLKIQHVLRNTPLSDVTGWIQEAKANRTWLILMYHQIDNTNSQYGTTPQLLQAHVDAMRASGVQVKTIDQALDTAGL